MDSTMEKVPCLVCSSEVDDAAAAEPPATAETIAQEVENVVGLKDDKNDVKTLEAINKHLSLNVSIPQSMHDVHFFCSKCDQVISEMLQLYKRKAEIEDEISMRISKIEKSVSEVEDSPFSKHDTKSEAFANQFREQICRRAKRLKGVGKEEKSHSVLGLKDQHGLMEQGLTVDMVGSIQIKVQPPEDDDDQDEGDCFGGIINPYCEEGSDAEDENDSSIFNCAVEIQEGEDKVDISGRSRSVSPVIRRLRPRRSKIYNESEEESDLDYRPKKSNTISRSKVTTDSKSKVSNSSKSKVRTISKSEIVEVQVKAEPESEDTNGYDGVTDFFNENDDSAQEDDGEQDDPDVNFSQDESAGEEDSDSGDENWNTPKKRKVETRKRTSSSGVSGGRKPRKSRSKTGLGRGRPKKKDRSDNDITTTPEGKMFYQDIEIFKTDLGNSVLLKCGDCGKEITVTECQLKAMRESIFYKMKVHIRGIHLGEYKCPICPKNMSNGKTLRRHIARHCADRPIATCPICEKPFKTTKKEFLEGHMWSHKSEEEKLEAIAAGEKPPLTYAEKVEAAKAKRSNQLFKCKECGSEHIWLSQLNKHIFRHHTAEEEKVRKYVCEKCNKTYATQGDLTAHKKLVCEKEKLARLYFCSFCSKNFTSKEDVTKHERKHTKDKPFICTKCNKCYTQEKTLKAHMNDCEGETGDQGGHLYHGVEITRVDHDVGFTLKCGCCDYTIDHDKVKMPRHETFRKIHVHIKGRHLGAYKCNICGKQLSEPKSLRNHLASHDTERPPTYVCEICAKPFRTKHNRKFLQTHMWSHMSEAERQERIDAGETPPLTYAEKVQKIEEKGADSLCQCDECGKTFRWQCQLKKHKRVHSTERNFQCPICGKFYATADGVNSHTKHVHDKNLVHTWHHCSFCERKFSHKFAWRKHERSHRRDTLKPYSCSVCHKAFLVEKSFRAHVAKCQKKPEESNSSSGPLPGSPDVENNNSRLILSDCEDPQSSINSFISAGHSTTGVPPNAHSTAISYAQLRNHLVHAAVAGPSSAAGAFIPDAHFLASGSSVQGTPSNRFYEDGTSYPNFY